MTIPVFSSLVISRPLLFFLLQYWCRIGGLSTSQFDGGFVLGGINVQNMALLAKRNWRFRKEDTSLWRQVIRIIHGKVAFNGHTTGKYGNSLTSPWVSISRVGRKVEAFALFKLGNGRRIAFWTDSWVDDIPLNLQLPKLFRIALLPIGSLLPIGTSPGCLGQ